MDLDRDLYSGHGFHLNSKGKEQIANIHIHLDMIRKYTDGLWSVTFSKCVMLYFTWLACVLGCLLYCIVLYLLHIPAHPYKAKAIGYRTCHTTSLLNQQVVNRIFIYLLHFIELLGAVIHG
jgi:hypothetical protein